MPVESTEVHLLGMQAAQGLAELIVGFKVLCIDRIGDLGRSTFVRLIALITKEDSA